MDPSFRSWGIAEGMLDLSEGYLTDVNLQVIKTAKGTTKQVRTNSDDMQRAMDLAGPSLEVGRRNKVVFVECPVGSQSANGMKAYGVSVGVLGAMRAEGIQLIEVTAYEVKKALTGNKNASKEEMIKAAIGLYPNANWPKSGGRIVMGTAEHMADAIGAIHAGVLTPVFQNLLRLYAEV
uniref:Holliday junction resolvase n=1 Tax=Pseudomonas phage Arace01 TaxID=3138526 RepID=A0AAU6VZP4_9VIRU